MTVEVNVAGEFDAVTDEEIVPLAVSVTVAELDGVLDDVLEEVALRVGVLDGVNELLANTLGVLVILAVGDSEADGEMDPTNSRGSNSASGAAAVTVGSNSIFASERTAIRLIIPFD